MENKADHDLVGVAIAKGAELENWNEVESEFIRFELSGDSVEGRLKEKIQTTVRGNRTYRYTLLTKSGKRVSFLGGVELDDKLAVVGIGRTVKVVYVDKESTGQEGFEMKHFKVFVKPEPYGK